MKSEMAVRLLERIDSRFYGKYRAFVSDNADPENRGRLRLQIPDALGDTIISGWALPCAPYGGAPGLGFFFIPDKNAGVWVEFEQGDLDYPVWVGTFWAKPGGTTEVSDPAGSQSPPTSKIIQTTNHKIEFADASGSEAITITDNVNSNVVTLDKNGVTITTNQALKITAQKDIELTAQGDLKLTATNVKVKVSGSMDIS
jgi:uncharacterized protein involved in type VI secretion and phage assembly